MKQILILLSLTFIVACAESFDINKLPGEWELESWTKKDNGEAIEGQMDFTFNADETYAIDYGNQTETGKYWISGPYLHTKEEGQAEKKVLITRLTDDTFTFEMNRAGSIEVVQLTKQ